MIAIMLFLSFGYYVTVNEKPLHLAAGFAGLTAILSLLFGASIVSILISTAVLFVYSGVVYYILDNYGDAIAMHFAILLVGAGGLFFLPVLA